MNRMLPPAVALALLPAMAFAQARETVVLTLPDVVDSGVAAGIDASGVEVGELIADRDFVGSVPAGGLDEARAALPAGVAMEPLAPANKLMTLDREAAATDAPGRVAVQVIPATGAGDEAVAEALGRLPLTIVDPNQHLGWVLELDAADLERLAQEPIVESIHAAPPPGTLN